MQNCRFAASAWSYYKSFRCHGKGASCRSGKFPYCVAGFPSVFRPRRPQAFLELTSYPEWHVRSLPWAKRSPELGTRDLESKICRVQLLQCRTPGTRNLDSKNSLIPKSKIFCFQKFFDFGIKTLLTLKSKNFRPQNQKTFRAQNQKSKVFWFLIFDFLFLIYGCHPKKVVTIRGIENAMANFERRDLYTS